MYPRKISTEKTGFRAVALLPGPLRARARKIEARIGAGPGQGGLQKWLAVDKLEMGARDQGRGCCATEMTGIADHAGNC
jgi:hypothetical protein